MRRVEGDREGVWTVGGSSQWKGESMHVILTDSERSRVRGKKRKREKEREKKGGRGSNQAI